MGWSRPKRTALRQSGCNSYCSHSHRQLVYQKQFNQDGTLGNVADRLFKHRKIKMLSLEEGAWSALAFPRSPANPATWPTALGTLVQTIVISRCCSLRLGKGSRPKAACTCSSPPDSDLDLSELLARSGGTPRCGMRPQRLTIAFRFPPIFPLFVYNPAFRTFGRPRLAIYSLPSIDPTCGGSRSR